MLLDEFNVKKKLNFIVLFNIHMSNTEEIVKKLNEIKDDKCPKILMNSFNDSKKAIKYLKAMNDFITCIDKINNDVPSVEVSDDKSSITSAAMSVEDARKTYEKYINFYVQSCPKINECNAKKCGFGHKEDWEHRDHQITRIKKVAISAEVWSDASGSFEDFLKDVKKSKLASKKK